MAELNQSELRATIIKNHTYGSITTPHQGQDRDIFDTLASRTENPIVTITVNSSAEFTLNKDGQYTRTLTGSISEYNQSSNTEMGQRILRRAKFSDLTGYWWLSGYEKQPFFMGYIYTESFKREFSEGSDKKVTIIDTHYPETFIFQAGNPSVSEDGLVTYKITTELDTIKSCIAAAKARSGNQCIVVNIPLEDEGSSGNNSYKFTIVSVAAPDMVRAIAAMGDQEYNLLLSATEGESSLTIKNDLIDLSDYYTKEETNTKLSGYAPVYDCSWILKSTSGAVTDEEYNSAVTALSKGYLFQLQKGLYKIPVLVNLHDGTASNPVLYFNFFDQSEGVLRIIQVRKGGGAPLIYSDGAYVLLNKQDKPTIEYLANAQSVSVSGETSNLYSGTSLTSLTIAAAKTDNSQNGCEEVFQFSTGASPAITITGVSWANSDTPTFEANKTYEIHIMYNSTLDKFLATYAVYE